MSRIEKKRILHNHIQRLIECPGSRPFLFRTRFEREMICVKAFAEEAGMEELYKIAAMTQRKMKQMVDWSNTTPWGELSSFELLNKDLVEILKELDAA